MAPLILYHNPVSPHSRGALWVIRYLGLEVELRNIDLVTKEQLKPDFIKINPQHCVPTLVDGDFILWEARVIGAYLVNSRAPGSSLYPTDPKQRALVDQRLYFDVATLYKRARDIFHPIVYGRETKIPDEKRKLMWEAFGLLDGFLEGNQFVAGGDSVSIADIFIMTSMAGLVNVGYDISSYKNIVAWYERNKSLKGFDECLEGAIAWANRNKRTLDDHL